MLLGVLGVPGAALADTQSHDDGVGDGVQAYWGTPDITNVSWDVSGGTATMSLTTNDADLYSVQYTVFLDTTHDGVADYKVQFFHNDGSSSSPRWSGALTTETGDSCHQNTPSSPTSTDLSVTESNNHQTATVSFPVTSIGGATSFRWAAEGVAFNLGAHNGVDYLPDRTYEACGGAWEEMYSSGKDGDLTLSKGYEFPTPPGPTVRLTSPPDGATYDQGATVQADYSCSDYNGQSPASCSGQDSNGFATPNGGAIDTFTPGDHYFGVSVVDDQGLSASVQHHYFVKPADGTTPGSTDPGTGDPGTGDPGTGDPGPGDPGNDDPGTPKANHYSLKGLDPDTTQKVELIDPAYVPACDSSSPEADSLLCEYITTGYFKCGDPITCALITAKAAAFRAVFAQRAAALATGVTSWAIGNVTFNLPDKIDYEIRDSAGQIVGVGSGGIVGVGSGGIVGVGAGGIVGVGAGGIVGVGAGGVVSVGAGNIKAKNGGQIVGVGSGGFQLKDHLGNVVAVGAGNVKDAAGHVVAVGAGNVVAVGAGNLQLGLGQVVAVGAGNLLPSSFVQSLPMVGPGKLTEKISINPANLISENGASLITENGAGFLHNRIAVAVAKRKLPKNVVIATGQASRTEPGVALVRVKFTKAGKQLLAAIRKDRKRKKGKHLKALRFTTSLTFTAKGEKPVVVRRSGRAAPHH